MICGCGTYVISEDINCPTCHRLVGYGTGEPMNDEKVCTCGELLPDWEFSLDPIIGPDPDPDCPIHGSKALEEQGQGTLL